MTSGKLTPLSVFERPLFYPLFVLIAVIIFNDRHPLSLQNLFLISGTLLLGVLLFWVFKKKGPLRFCLYSLLFFTLSVSLLLWVYPSAKPLDPTLLDRKRSFEGEIVEAPQMKGDKIKLTLSLNRVLTSPPRETFGKILLTLLGDATDLRKGDQIRFATKLKEPLNYKNPGGFDYVRYLKRKGIAATAFIKSEKSIGLLERAPLSPWERGITRFKEKTKERLSQQGNREGQGIIVALLWGDHSLLDLKTKELFRSQGINHLLIISGLHFAIFSFLVFQFILNLTRLFPRLLLLLNVRKLAAVGTLLFLTLYYFFCEPSPSITRAYIAIVCYLVALLLNRSRDWLNVLFLAALIILVIEPANLFNLSFQFSFTAVLSLVLIFPVLRRRIVKAQDREEEGKQPRYKRASRWVLGKFVDLFLVNLSIFIGLTPLLIFYFHRLQGFSILMNLWAVPYFEIFVVPLGLIALVIQMISPSFSSLLFSLDLEFIRGTLWMLQKASDSLPQPWLVFPPRPWELLVYYILVLTLILQIRPRFKKTIVFAILVIFLADVGWTLRSMYVGDEFKITHLDVGQGDSLLVELPGAKRVLVDGGGSPFFDIGENVLIPFLLYKRIPHLDAVCATHSDLDHYGGLVSLIKNYRIQELWWNGVPDQSPAYRELFELAKSRGVKIVSLKKGMTFSVGLKDHFDVLSPGEVARKEKKDNNHSLVFRIAAQGHTALLTGDIEKSIEQRLIRNNSPTLKADYLKVPHHGSKTSSSKAFLQKVQPKLATASMRYQNWFGHPHPYVLGRFKDLGIPFYRTDHHGAIEIDFKEKGIQVKTFVAADDQVFIE